MDANERFQADVQQTKADFSQIKSEIRENVDQAKVKIGDQLQTEGAKDAAVFRTEKAKDDAVFDAARGDARVGLEKLQAKREQLKATVAAATGEARTKAKAELDSINADIDKYEALNEAALAEYFEKRDAGEIGLN